MTKKTTIRFDDQLIAAWTKSSFAFQEINKVNAITAKLTSQTDFITRIKDHLSTNFEMVANVDRLMRSHPDLYSKIQEFGDPDNKFKKYIDLLFTSEFAQSDSLKSLYDSFPTYDNDDLIDNVHVENNGDVSIGSNTVSLTSLDKELETLPNANSESTQEAYQNFIAWFKTLSKSAQFIILNLIIPYLVSIFATATGPLFEDWASKFNGIEKRVAKKVILNDVREFYQPWEVKNHRFVNASTLNVRASNSDRSKIIDILIFGKSIILIEKNKSWSLIKYFDSDGNIKQGWVFGRYLHKLMK